MPVRFRRKANHAHVYEIARQNETHVTLRSMIENVLPRRTFEEGYEPVPGARTAYDAIGSGVKAPRADDWGDLALRTAESILYYLGHGADASKEPGADRHRDELCRIIEGALSAHTATGAGPVGEADAKAAMDEAWRNLGAPPSTPSPQIGKAGAGPAGEAVAYSCEVLQHDDTWRLTFSEAVPVAPHGGAIRNVRRLYAHPVEEPGEVERLTRERDEARQWGQDQEQLATRYANERHTAEAALAETREHLEKVEAALEPFAKVAEWLAFDVQDSSIEWPEYMAFATGTWPVPDMPTTGDLRRARAALTGDAQEAKAPAGDA